MKYTHKIYIGYDSKQSQASEVCEYSIRKHLKNVSKFAKEVKISSFACCQASQDKS